MSDDTLILLLAVAAGAYLLFGRASSGRRDGGTAYRQVIRDRTLRGENEADVRRFASLGTRFQALTKSGTTITAPGVRLAPAGPGE